MPCGFGLAGHDRGVARGRRRPPAGRSLRAVAERPRVRGRRVGPVLAPGAAGRSTGSRCSPSSSTRPPSTACRRPTRGRASTDDRRMTSPSSFRATFDCLWCGDAVGDARTRRPRGLGAAVPDLPRQGGLERRSCAARLRAALAARGRAVAPDERAGDRRRRPVRRSRRRPPREPGAARPPRPTFPDDWFLRRGAVRARRPPRHGLGGGARRRHPLARRPAARRTDRGARRGRRVLLAADRRQGRGPRLGRRRRCAGPRARAPRRPPPAGPPARRRPVGRPAPARASPGPTPSSPRSCSGRVRGAGLDTAAASLLARLRPGGRLASIELLPDAGRRPAGRTSRGRGTTRRSSGRRSAAAGFRGIDAHDDRALLRARGRRGGLTAAVPEPRNAHDPVLSSGAMSTPREPHDRDRRLRRHGRGDDRRAAPRQPRRRPSQVIASHPRAERREALAAAHGIGTVASNTEAIAGADVIILAVKPQMLARVGREIGPQLRAGPARAVGPRRPDDQRPRRDARPRPGRARDAQHAGPHRQRHDRLVRDARHHRGPARPGPKACSARSAPSWRSRTRSGSRWRPPSPAPAPPTCSW